MLIIAYDQFKIIMSEFPELENLEKQIIAHGDKNFMNKIFS